MKKNQINRIREMEENLDISVAAIGKLSEALEEFEKIEKKYYDLENYYSSTQWMRDYEDDEAGKLPEDLKRGVLSEDAVYDLITEHRSLMARMQRAVLHSLENDND